MSSVLRPVRKRKKVRTLGPVDIIRREDYADLAGERYGKDASMGGRRHGSNPGTVGLAGQRVPIRVPRLRRVAGSEIPLRSYAALHGEGAVNDLLLKRWDLMPQLRRRRGDSRGNRAVGVDRGQRGEAPRTPGAGPSRRGRGGHSWTDVRTHDGHRAGQAEKTLPGLRRNGHRERAGADAVPAVVGRAGPRRLPVLVILDGGKGLRSAVRKAFRNRALVQRCQWHARRGEVSGQTRAGFVAPAPPTSSVRRGPPRARDAPSRAGGPEPICGGRAGRDPDAASPRAVRGAGPVAEDDELSRVHQCARRRTLCEGRSLAELEPTPPLAGDRAPGHRTTLAEGDGLPAPAHAPCRVEAREDRHDDVEDESRVSNQEP